VIPLLRASPPPARIPGTGGFGNSYSKFFGAGSHATTLYKIGWANQLYGGGGDVVRIALPPKNSDLGTAAERGLGVWTLLEWVQGFLGVGTLFRGIEIDSGVTRQKKSREFGWGAPRGGGLA